MKLFYFALKIFSIFVIILCINLNSGCKSPEEYEPPPDSLIPPPEAPELIRPPDDTSYWFGQAGQSWDFVVVVFEWTSVSDAQFYELEIATTPNFGTSVIYDIKVSSTKTTVLFYNPVNCYWHVRAESNQWTWFTDWSEIRYLRIRWPI